MQKTAPQARDYCFHFIVGETGAPRSEVRNPGLDGVWPGLESWQSDATSLGVPSYSEGRELRTYHVEPLWKCHVALESPHWRTDFQERIPPLTLGFEQGGFWLRGAWWPWCQGWSRTIWCTSTSAGAWDFLEVPEPMLSAWGLRRASLQLAQGLPRKNKPCRKKKNNEEKRKMCCYF